MNTQRGPGRGSGASQGPKAVKNEKKSDLADYFCTCGEREALEEGGAALGNIGNAGDVGGEMRRVERKSALLWGLGSSTCRDDCSPLHFDGHEENGRHRG